MGHWRPTLFFSLILAEILIALSIHGLFSRLEAGQAKAVATVIGSLLRDESTMSRSYLIAQSIEDMQTLKAITCARLSRFSDGKVSVFYDSTFKDDCPLRRLESVTLPGLDGNSWNFQLVPHVDLSFYILKWITWLVSATLLLLAYRVLIGILANEKRKQDSIVSQRIFLEELADQIRHDVASPMSALKVIAERAPLDDQTKDFLRAAVNRTAGIFDTLKQFKVEDQEVDVELEIKKIVDEKRLIRANFAAVHIDTGNLVLVLNKVEFCRMISNLLDNSFEAGAKQIRIHAVKGTNSLRLVIADDGAEIPEQVLKNLGIRGNTHGKKTGSGLGLSRTYKFMQSLGGELKLSNETESKVQLVFPKL